MRFLETMVAHASSRSPGRQCEIKDYHLLWRQHCTADAMHETERLRARSEWVNEI